MRGAWLDRWRTAAVAVVALCAAAVAPAAEVNLASAGAAPLKAQWFAPPGDQARPVVIALHGCGGMYNAKGDLSPHMRDHAERLNASGMAVLLPDSFGSRGIKSICSTPYGQRSIRLADRRRDVLTAVEWLKTQPGVDAKRIALLGWSNGASTALTVMDPARGTVPPIAAVAAYYPGCGGPEQRQIQLAPVPLLMLLGADDDWTRPEPCIALGERLKSQQHDVTWHVYPDSVHDFDTTVPVRVLTSVKHVNPSGVKLGGNPAARAQSLTDLDAFFARTLRAAEPAKP